MKFRWTISVLISSWALAGEPATPAPPPVKLPQMNVSAPNRKGLEDLGFIYDEDLLISPPKRLTEVRPIPNSEAIRLFLDAGVDARVQVVYVVDKKGAVRDVQATEATVTNRKTKTDIDRDFIESLIAAKALPEKARTMTIEEVRLQIATEFGKMAIAFLENSKFEPGTRLGFPVATRCQYGFGWGLDKR